MKKSIISEVLDINVHQISVAAVHGAAAHAPQAARVVARARVLHVDDAPHATVAAHAPPRLADLLRRLQHLRRSQPVQDVRRHVHRKIYPRRRRRRRGGGGCLRCRSFLLRQLAEFERLSPHGEV